MKDKYSILAVDDSIPTLDMYKKILSSKYNVFTADSALSALNFVKSNNVDIILLDIEMPHVSGFKFLYEIRKIPSYVNVPIIIISIKTDEDFIKEAKNSTAFDALAKPVGSRILYKKIEQAIKEKYTQLVHS